MKKTPFIKLSLRLRDLNFNKSYNSPQRKYEIYIDDKLVDVLDQRSSLKYDLSVRVGQKLKVVKRYGHKLPDSTYTYVIGSNRATLKDSTEECKTVRVEFIDDENILKVLSDVEYKRVKTI